MGETQKAKKRAKKLRKGSQEAQEAAETDVKGPEGPEPQGLKEKVKRGFWSEKEALEWLKKAPLQSPHIVKWLRRRRP